MESSILISLSASCFSRVISSIMQVCLSKGVVSLESSLLSWMFVYAQKEHDWQHDKIHPDTHLLFAWRGLRICVSFEVLDCPPLLELTTDLNVLLSLDQLFFVSLYRHFPVEQSLVFELRPVLTRNMT